jgi:transcriptional regulator with XRE-family HTH domain
MSILEKTRKEHNLTKAQMARRLGVGKSYYSMLLKGDRGISKNIALRLQKEFGVSLDISLRGQFTE